MPICSSAILCHSQMTFIYLYFWIMPLLLTCDIIFCIAEELLTRFFNISTSSYTWFGQLLSYSCASRPVFSPLMFSYFLTAPFCIPSRYLDVIFQGNLWSFLRDFLPSRALLMWDNFLSLSTSETEPVLLLHLLPLSSSLTVTLFVPLQIEAFLPGWLIPCHFSSRATWVAVEACWP